MAPSRERLVARMDAGEEYAVAGILGESCVSPLRRAGRKAR
jgi:hypothetical protein